MHISRLCLPSKEETLQIACSTFDSHCASLRLRRPKCPGDSQLGLLRLIADSGTALVPLLRDVRRVIARTGDPHLMVGLRLHYARVEASRHSPGESGRHLKAANALLQGFPNAWLQGRVHLGFCIVNTLSGDYQRAIAEAELAIQCAASSGHARTELAGLINLSHARQAIGRLKKHKKQSIECWRSRVTTSRLRWQRLIRERIY